MAAVVDIGPTSTQHRVELRVLPAIQNHKSDPSSIVIFPVFVTVHHSDLMQIAGTQSSTTHTPRNVYKAREKKKRNPYKMFAVLLNVGAVSYND